MIMNINIIKTEQDYEQALAVLRPLAEDLKLTSVYNTIGAIAVRVSVMVCHESAEDSLSSYFRQPASPSIFCFLFRFSAVTQD